MNLRKCEVKAGELVLPIRNCYSLPFVSKPTRRVFNKDAVRCTFSAVCKDSVSREVSKDIEKIQKYGIDRVVSTLKLV